MLIRRADGDDSLSDLAERAARLLGRQLVSSACLQGGDLSDVMRVSLGPGESVVVKSSPLARVEADMLRAIRASVVPAPEVLAVADDLLVIEDLGRDDGPRGAWCALGETVRTLHAAQGHQYGWRVDYRFGPVEILNAAADDWPSFWSERRLMAGIRDLPTGMARRIEDLCARLGERLPRHPAPSLLHGDLWPGNVMARGRTITGLIDPACYYGHAEVDLAMLCLFGTPHADFWAGYGPLEAGFEERQPLYQLWPALVHLRLFGGAYGGLVECLLDRIEAGGR